MDSSVTTAPATGLALPFASEDVRQMLTHVGVIPEQVLDRADTADMLTRCGFKVSKQTLAKIACTRADGPAYRVAFGRAMYRAGDALAWAMTLMRDPADSPQRRGAQTRRERGDTFGPRKRRHSEMQEAAA
jgi:hypothetical protein